ncbi:MAG: hypothetical protein L0332_08210 [Chloroflexi bacterium]|nr:hypothetical protein [Chloroflexota bacterium]MCI0575649.1 hypothetical protein [Chloroflexota bacterium]MCI0644717.1 hypothetical protein [Chloroflexota bacterium]MCI0726690.1 hypothetical protein [Chloroflexota bacterium]
MTKGKVQLTEEQQKRNQGILDRLEADKRRLFEETRALQQQYRHEIKSQRPNGQMGEETSGE